MVRVVAAYAEVGVLGLAVLFCYVVLAQLADYLLLQLFVFALLYFELHDVDGQAFFR